MGVQDVFRDVARASYTRGENLHLTVKFLGEVADDRVKEVCDALGAVRGAGGFELAADRVECFPERGRIRIIGAGMETPAELTSLVNEIEEACAKVGFARERRAYKAHVTLARAKMPLPQQLRGRLEQVASGLFPGPRMNAGKFVLMQSVLKREGAEYTPAAHFVI